ncbi:TraR/DksA C4-type zinc finger protein [Halopseudomonas nanhaiensis]|uniref:TraR/DksA family transcriptional regulator n=1 Tax=Halopseudomonas nanhaiensis TaxID=2830842 RepID=UPI001CBF1A3C|nr:TraR/DksA C4-type zinc finger protein [Halopseudomonas nanhaiensis]UAW98659.1 TraR/DksA C4-type zinc finger protein [Halopseudomonas nanhaiensis]
MDATLKAELKALILQRIEELEPSVDARAQRSENVELDQAKVGRLSRMDALQQQAMHDATQARSRNQLLRLQHALARLDQDDYGYCSECDEEIASGRLRIDPAVGLCVECASKLQP